MGVSVGPNLFALPPLSPPPKTSRILPPIPTHHCAVATNGRHGETGWREGRFPSAGANELGPADSPGQRVEASGLHPLSNLRRRQQGVDAAGCSCGVKM